MRPCMVMVSMVTQGPQHTPSGLYCQPYVVFSEQKQKHKYQDKDLVADVELAEQANKICRCDRSVIPDYP